MKTYEITLITPQGIRVEVYCTSEPLKDFEEKMVKKYGTFITHQSKLIN